MSLQTHLRPEAITVPLPYSIADCSAHSGRYVAENILVDKSTDQSSRWSGAHQGNAKQWILLQLENPAVLKSITFGKYFKPHPCNMKEFKIYVGLNRECLTQVLHAGLKNDPVPETFSIKFVNDAGICFPTRFVKVEPISAHGGSFHTSIWHISMTGIADETFVERVRITYDEHREATVVRHILKHLRQRRLFTPYEAILSRSGFQAEHPLITQLHESIVLQGDLQQAEELVLTISKAGLFDSYLHGSQAYAHWKRLHGTDADGDVPSPRGGHAMCIDPGDDIIYLFGGWDGQKSLDDLWAYSIKEDKWRVLSHSTAAEQNAPGARSCHKMVFCTKTGSIYLLGRLSDSDAAKAPGGANPSSPAPSNSEESVKTFCSEFYRYHTRGADSGKWDFLSFDTASSGGPPLMFDHQMVMDSDAQMLYVFGGRVFDGDLDTVKYSGLYSYNVRTSKWALLQQLDDPDRSQTIIPSRSGHSMVLEPLSHRLFIFAGQRGDKYLSDMFAYDIATNTATELFSNFTAAGGPDACFTQRAVIDPDLHEVYVFCGLTRSTQAASATTLAAESPNWLFTYGQSPGKWSRILPHPVGVWSSQSGADPQPLEEPLPRYAHQVVYNPRTNTVFLHGGNAGVVGQMEMKRGANGVGQEEGKEKRLDDLWQMKLTRAGPEDVIRRAIYRIRQQRFREMCEDTSPIKALKFLQTEVFAVVDHNDLVETETFRSLLTYLLSPSPPSPPVSVPPISSDLPLASSLEHTISDTDETSKRSRSRTPEGGRWTNELYLDMGNSELNTAAAHEMRGISADALREVEDPLEQATGKKGKKLTSSRFSQRMEVFESLMEYVSEGDKQPNGNLSDIVDASSGKGAGYNSFSL